MNGITYYYNYILLIIVYGKIAIIALLLINFTLF